MGITIRVKLGIGAGRIFQCGVGNQDYHHFVCFGPGVRSASDAEHHCESGEVIMELSAWELCNPMHFNFNVKGDGFIRIHEITAFVNPELRGRPMLTLGSNKPRASKLVNLDTGLRNGKTDCNPVNLNAFLIFPSYIKILILLLILEMRPSIIAALEKKSELQLRYYVIPPVLKKVSFFPHFINF